MGESVRGYLCALAAFGPPMTMLWLGGGDAPDVRLLAFGAAGWALILAGEASWRLALLAFLPLLQLTPGPSPPELADAMAAAAVAGPGTIAADPAALWSETVTLAGCVAVFALARTAASLHRQAAWCAAAAVAIFGCFEAAARTLVNRGQLAALLELTFGVGCGLVAASWAGRSWRERFEDRALLGGSIGAAAILFSLAGIALSLSRTGIIVGALAAVAAGLWLARRRPWIAVTLALTLAAVVPAASPTLERACDRFERLVAERGDPGRSAVWADSFELARAHWATGVGFGSFPSAFRRSSVYLPRKSVDAAHSDYLEWFVELGAPGATLLAGSVLTFFLAAARRAKDSPLVAGCLLGVGAILLHASLDLPFQLPGLAALTSALLGLGQQRFAKGESVAVPVGTEQTTAPGETRRKRMWPASFREFHRGRFSAAPLQGCCTLLRHRRAAGLAFGLALLALAIFVHLRTETPQTLCEAAGEASAKGGIEQAGLLYRRALDRNLFTAPAWLRLAEIERSRGHIDQARLYLEAARTVEPFTLRTEWPLADLELASGDVVAGTSRLAPLIAAAPDLLDAALHTVWRSGADVQQLERLVLRNDPESAGRYLAFLARNGLPERLSTAYARLGSPELPPSYRDWLAREAGFRP